MLEEDVAQKQKFAEHSSLICKFFILSLFINNRYFACCSAKFHETHITRFCLCRFALKLLLVVRVQKKCLRSGRKLEQSLIWDLCICMLCFNVWEFRIQSLVRADRIQAAKTVNIIEPKSSYLQSDKFKKKNYQLCYLIDITYMFILCFCVSCSNHSLLYLY